MRQFNKYLVSKGVQLSIINNNNYKQIHDLPRIINKYELQNASNISWKIPLKVKSTGLKAGNQCIMNK